MIKSVFRNPYFPILVETEGKTYGVRSLNHLEKLLKINCFKKTESYTVIDCKGEGWMFMPEIEALRPLTAKKRWNKKEIISFYNQSLELEFRFSPKSLSNITLPTLVKDIAAHDNSL